MEGRQLLRETTARFLEKYGSLRYVREACDDVLAFDREAWLQGAKLGWAAMLVPEEHGGGTVSGEGLLDLVEIAEELGRVLHPAPFLSTNVVAFAISRSGSPQLREELLPSVAAGELPGAWCDAEPSGSYEPADLALSIRERADGFELHGRTRYVQDGHCAGVFLATGRDDSGGVTQVVVQRDTPGVSVAAMSCMDLSRRVAEVRFDRTIVPSTAVIGVAGEASDDVANQVSLALVLQCADSVGGMTRVNEMTFEYAKDRYAFGRPIGSFQAIKHKCVEMYLGLIGARAVTAAAAEALQFGLSDAVEKASLAKAFVGDAFSLSVAHSIQIHGGIGCTWEHDAHLYSRHAKFNEAMFGSPGWHRGGLARRLGV